MDLETGEKIIFQGHPSWRSIIGFYIKGLVVVIVAAVVAAFATDTVITVLVAVAALAILFVAGYSKRLFTTYTISDHRLHIRRGILSRDEQQTHINRVQNVNTHQSALERVLQVGTVDFDTAAGDDYDFQFAGVAEPREVVDAVHRAQRESDAVTGRTG